MNDYERIGRSIAYLEKNQSSQPSLDVLAKQAGLSLFHFHRLFTRWAGITPKDFLQCLTLSHAKRLLKKGENVFNSALDAGLSGSGRLHDLSVTLEAASPGEIKSGGATWVIQAGFSESPFGPCLIGESPRGICHLSFVESKDRQAGAKTIREYWPEAKIEWNNSSAKRLCKIIFLRNPKQTPHPVLRAFVRGTPFQIRVWRALLSIPKGSFVTYNQLAKAVGNPGAARAVGSAVGRNFISYLIPCHRVIRETGVLGEYHWGSARKKAITAWESSHF